MPAITTGPQPDNRTQTPPRARRDLTWPLLGFVALGAVASAAVLPRLVTSSLEGADAAPERAAAASAAAAAPGSPGAGDSAGADLTADADFAAAARRLGGRDLRAAYAACVAADRQAASYLRRTVPAPGAPASPALVRAAQERYRRPLCEQYGLTFEQLDAVARHGSRAGWPRPR